jgi:pre-mRNA-splicing factor 18
LTPSLPSAARSTASPGPEGTGTPPANPGVAFNISNEETIRRLRAKGQPIRLFGESDKDRRLRLRALELIEEKGHERVGGQNDFRRALEDVESAERSMRDRNANSTADEGKGKKKDDSASGEGEIAVLDMALIKTDPDKLYPIIYYALKRVLKEWGESLAERPGMASLVSRSSSSLADTSRRACKENDPGEAGLCDAGAVCTIPQTTFQVVTI